MKRPWIRITALVLAAVLGWFTYAAIRAHRNLVTLDVRDMPVRDVVRKIEWQTWETIMTHKEVNGNVTLRVKDVPLEEVLGMIGEQVSSRWTAYYPLFSSGKSLAAFMKSVRGEANPADVGWTNLVARNGRFRGGPGGFGGPGGPGGFGGGGEGGRADGQGRPAGNRGDFGGPRGGFGGPDGPGGFGGPGFGGPGGGMFAENLRDANGLVSVNISAKDLTIATMALGRFSQAQVVPEDGTAGLVTMNLQQAPMEEAVKRLARQVKRKWDHYYALRGGGGRGRGEFAARRDDGPDEEPTAEERELMREQRRRQQEELVETLTAEDRQRLEEQRKQMEEMRNLTPEQRRERFEQMANSPQMEQRRDNRMSSQLKNTTPLQRAQRAQEMQERMQRRNDPSNTNRFGGGGGGRRGGFRGGP